MPRPFSREEQREIADSIHFHLVHGFVLAAGRDLVFQGGTCLAMAWDSPRYSEDVDFLFSRDKDAAPDRAMGKALQLVRDALQLRDPLGKVEVVKKERGQTNPLIIYQIKYTHQERRGKIQVHADVLRIAAASLHSYRRAIRSVRPPAGSGYRLDVVVPVATPQMLYVDKIFAMAFRPNPKWRDFFDVWWMRSQMRPFLPAPHEWRQEFVENVKTNLEIYGRMELELLQALKSRVNPQAKPPASSWEDGLRAELANWLPESFFRSLDTLDGFRIMAGFVEQEIHRVIEILGEPAGLGGNTGG